jgi:glutamate carboxypeptidase
MGHRDTVFPDGTAAQRPFRIDGDQAFGPGVADMKAGLVMNTFVLEALRRFGAPCPLTGLYTSDEEIA